MLALARRRPFPLATLAFATLAGAACGDRALTAPDAASMTPPVPDAGAPETPPTPGSLDWGQSVGIGVDVGDTLGGATYLGPLVPLADGGLIVAGTFSGNVRFAADKVFTAAGARDGFVARYRADQRLVWVVPLTATVGEVFVSSAARLQGDEVAVAGWFSGILGLGSTFPGGLTSAGGLDAFVLRVASDGSIRWAALAGGPDDDIVRDVAAAGGHIAITGAVGPGAVFGAGGNRQTTVPAGDGPIFAARLSATDGTLEWAQFAGGGVPSQGYAVATDGTLGSVVVTGYVNGPARFGSTVVDPADGRAFVALWDATGRLGWARPLAGSAGEGDAVAVTRDDSGDVIAAGTFEDKALFPTTSGTTALVADRPGQPGCYLARLQYANGSPRWARRLAGHGLRPWRLRVATAGDLLVAASFGGGTVLDPDDRATPIQSAGNDDALFMRLGAAGALVWAAPAGGPGDDEGADIAEGADGFVLGTGRYVGPAMFGNGTLAITLDSGTDGAGFMLRLWP